MTPNDLVRTWCQAHPWTLGYITFVAVLELLILITWEG